MGLKFRRLVKKTTAGLGVLLAVLALGLAAAFTAVACGKEAPASEATPTRLPTASPTATQQPAPTSPFPTFTPRPVAAGTPVPTASPAPAPTQPFRQVQTNLPRDEGPHGMPIEWWYFNGHLVDDKGEEYSFHYVTFQRVTASGLAPQVLQASFSHHVRQIYQVEERLALASTPTSPGTFSFQAQGWRMAGDGLDYVLAFDTRDYFLLLRAVSRKPAVLHQETGLVNMGPAGQSYYYSRTRLEASGTLKSGRETREVRGTLWMDHQWGDFITAPVGWDWVSLHLDDGSELMASVVWDVANRRPVASYGTYVAPDGSVEHLESHEVVFKSTGIWTSSTAETVYPSGWTVGVLPQSLVLTITPVVKAAEFAASSYIPVPYWEGAVAAHGTKNGVAIGAKGFVELVGYAPRKSGAISGATQGR